MISYNIFQYNISPQDPAVALAALRVELQEARRILAVILYNIIVYHVILVHSLAYYVVTI